MEQIKEELDKYIKKHRSNKLKSESFSEYLFFLMNQRKIDNPAYLYSKANISRQTFSSFIKNNNPSLNSCIKLAFTLHLTNKECKYLLKKAGFTLASSSIYSLIIRFCLENNLDLYTCNKMLINYGFEEIL